jgi:hypothetical protein
MISADSSNAVAEWLSSLKNKSSRVQYSSRWQYWINYCRIKGLHDNGDAQLKDMKRRRLLNDNSEKYFYDNLLPQFFVWLITEYSGSKRNEPLSENGAVGVTTAVRSFFAYHRYKLEIRKEAIPSVDKIAPKYEDHQFDIFQLRLMFAQGDLKERTILACGKDLWLRAGDFVNISRSFIENLLQREQEKAENEKRDTDVIEFELITGKEKEPASCHFSKESIELLKEYVRTSEQDWHSQRLFPLTEDSLNDTLRRLAEKARITVTGRIRWHCLRKFGITLMHGKVTEPVMKYMAGKHIDKSLRTYIQGNQETCKAFKMIEPLISLTNSSGTGNSQLAKELEELRKERFKLSASLKLLERITPKEQMEKAIFELSQEYGIKPQTEIKIPQAQDGTNTFMFPRLEVMTPSLEPFATELAAAIEKRNSEKVLKETVNGDINNQPSFFKSPRILPHM